MLKIGIMGSDKEYVESLMKYINEHYDDMKLMIFSTVSKIEDYCEWDSLDGMLIDRMLDVEVKCLSEDKITYLCENRDCNGQDIFKFQSMDEIHNMIIDLYRLDGSLIKNEKLSAVYSPLGNCGKTRYAIAEVNARENGFYIGWEDYSGMAYVNESEKQRFDEFMYYLTEKNVKLFEVLDKSYSEEKNGKYIRCNYIGEDAKCINSDMIKWLSGEICNMNKNYSLCFDIGIGAISDFDILSCMDRVYIPILYDEISRRKLQQFKNFLKERNVCTDNFYRIDADRNITRF